MAKRIGKLCILLGVVCLVAAGGFVAYNRWEADSAARTSEQLLADVQQVIRAEPVEPEEQTPTEMATVELEGNHCIGILSVPVLELELPVLTDWSYKKLKKAPCLYYGGYYEPNFVIAAHNYDRHFGRLSELQPGDIVIFTDVTGKEYHYEVALLETLPKTATEEMITSGFALSLYTCTPGGANRVTVRCNAKAPTE